MKIDTRVEVLELKDYREIDLDEAPAVAFACGHFFTAETLDAMYNLRGSNMASAVVPTESALSAIVGSHFRSTSVDIGIVGLYEVYETNRVTGDILGLKAVSSKMVLAIPKCPHY